MMKKIIALICLGLFAALAAAPMFDNITNTTHQQDLLLINDQLHVATWGGLLYYNQAGVNLQDKLTVLDGLTDNEIRCLDWIDQTSTLLAGTRSAGVNVIRNGQVRIPLDTNLGLAHNQVNAIAHQDSIIYVGTTAGLSVFIDSDSYVFPLLAHNYNSSNGLLGSSVNSILLADGYLYIATEIGLSIVNKNSLDMPSAWQTYPFDYQINDMAYSQGTLAVATRNGVYASQQLGVFDKLNIILEADYSSIFPIAFNLQGEIIFSQGWWDDEALAVEDYGTTFLYRYNLSDNQLTTYPADEQVTRQITDIACQDDTVYLSTWGQGLLTVVGNSITSYQESGPSTKAVTAITTDYNGVTWLCSGWLGAALTPRGTRGVSGFDGDDWVNYNWTDSPLASPNVMSIETDLKGRNWFAAWDRGTFPWKSGGSVYNPNDDTWRDLDWSAGILGTASAYVKNDPQGNTWLVSYVRGIVVYNQDLEVISQFNPCDNSENLFTDNTPDILNLYFGKNKVYMGTYNSGLVIMDYNPATDVPDSLELNGYVHYWKPPFNLNRIYEVVGYENNWGEEEIWIATDSGLYMYNQYNWYKYDVDVKRKIFSGGSFVNEVLYYADEERLFGSDQSTPVSLEADPFGRIWIGSANRGMSVYDHDTERFTNYKKSTHPLLSDRINALSYNPKLGLMFIGTDMGINTMKAGYVEKPEAVMEEVTLYPNPFNPNTDTTITIKNNNDTESFPRGKIKCRVYDLSGALVWESFDNLLGQFSWDGKNNAGKQVATGMYFWVVADEDGNIKRGRFAVIRK